MPRKKDSEDDNVNTSGWLATYSDMITLLLTFFVVMIAYASYDRVKFWSIIQSTREALGEGRVGVLPEWNSPMSDISAKYPGLTEDEEAQNFIKMGRGIKNLNQDIDYKITDKGMAIILPDKFILFDSGSAKIRAEALPTLKQIAEILNQALKEKLTHHDIQIAGHTDNRPIRNSNFANNWELSTARATNVLRILVDYGLDKSCLSAVGYADQRPVESNDTEDGKTKNRRVEIEIIKVQRPNTNSR